MFSGSLVLKKDVKDMIKDMESSVKGLIIKQIVISE